MSSKLPPAAAAQHAADTTGSHWSQQEPRRAEPEPFSLRLHVSVSGASTLHSPPPQADTDAGDDQQQSTSFIKI